MLRWVAPRNFVSLRTLATWRSTMATSDQNAMLQTDEQTACFGVRVSRSTPTSRVSSSLGGESEGFAGAVERFVAEELGCGEQPVFVCDGFGGGEADRCRGDAVGWSPQMHGSGVEINVGRCDHRRFGRGRTGTSQCDEHREHRPGQTVIRVVLYRVEFGFGERARRLLRLSHPHRRTDERIRIDVDSKRTERIQHRPCCPSAIAGSGVAHSPIRPIVIRASLAIERSDALGCQLVNPFVPEGLEKPFRLGEPTFSPMSIPVPSTDSSSRSTAVSWRPMSSLSLRCWRSSHKTQNNSKPVSENGWSARPEPQGCVEHRLPELADKRWTSWARLPLV